MLDRFLAVEPTEVIDAVEDAVSILVGDFHLHAVLGAHRQVDGLETLVQETGHRALCADIDPQLNVHAQLLDVVDFPFQDGGRQAVVRDAGPEHAAGKRGAFKDGGVIAFLGQEITGGKPGRTGADDGHLFGVGLFVDGRHRQGVPIHLVGGEALQLADGQGRIDVLAGGTGSHRGRGRRVPGSPAAASFP